MEVLNYLFTLKDSRIILGFIYNLFFAITLCYFVFRQEENKIWLKYAIHAVLITSAIFAVGVTLLSVIKGFTHPRQWDFPSFFLHSHVGTSGMNFYYPSTYHQIAKTILIPIELSSSFVTETLDVGFKYPPPTMLLLMPLGYFDFATAHLIWTVINLSFIGIVIFLSKKIFFSDHQWQGWTIAISLVFWFWASKAALGTENTNFWVLAMVLLTWRDRQLPRAGIWLGLGMLIKPIFLIVVGYFLLSKNWKAILICSLTYGIVTLIALLAYGPEVFITFLFENPNAIVPDIQYLERINQSLAAVVARATDFSSAKGDPAPIFHPIFILVSGLMGLITLILILRKESFLKPLGFCLVITGAVIVYPGSLLTYATMLLPIYMYLLENWKKLPIRLPRWGIPIFFLMGNILITLGWAFLANVLLWTVLAYWMWSIPSPENKLVLNNSGLLR